MNDKPMNPKFVEYDEEPPQPIKIADGTYIEPLITDTATDKQAAIERDDDPESASPSGVEVEATSWAAKRPKTLVLTGVLALFAALLVLSKIWRDGLTLAEFLVTGNEMTPTEKILSCVQSRLGEKMNAVSLADIEDTLRTLPFVRDVVATKEFPSAIRLRLIERVPVAVAVAGGKLRLIDDDGYALTADLSTLNDKRLPLLVGFEKIRRAENGLLKLDSAEAWNALQLLKEIRRRETAKMLLSEIHIENPKRLYALAPDAEAKFIFGDGGEYQRKLRYLDAFWKQVVVKKGLKSFEYIDLRFDGKIFAK